MKEAGLAELSALVAAAERRLAPARLYPLPTGWALEYVLRMGGAGKFDLRIHAVYSPDGTRAGDAASSA